MTKRRRLKPVLRTGQAELGEGGGDFVAEVGVGVGVVVGDGGGVEDGADHGDFVAAVALGAADAFGPDFERKGRDVDDVEAELFEEGAFVGEGEDALDLEAAGFFEDGGDEGFADATAVVGGVDGEGADFGEVGPDDFEGGDAEDGRVSSVQCPVARGRKSDVFVLGTGNWTLDTFFKHEEVAEGFVEFGVGAEEHLAALGVGGDEGGDGGDVADGGGADHDIKNTEDRRQ